jgi:acetyl esterase/lipase
MTDLTGDAGRYPPELARLTASQPGAHQIVRYGPSPGQFGEFWPGGGRVAVLIHGGYWRTRYRLDLMHLLAADLNDRGYTVWNIEYRRMDMPGGGWPGTFDDVTTALDALADLRGAPADLGQVGLIGHSAGGLLALWLARQAAAPSARVSPAVVVSLAGVCDLLLAAQLRLSDGAVAELLGGLPSDRPEVYRQADPAALVSRGVPELVVHGTADTHVPYELSRRYAAATGSTLLSLPGVGHFEMIDPDTAAWSRIADEIARLLPGHGAQEINHA